MAGAEKPHDSKPNNNTRNITDNGRTCVSQRQRDNAFMSMYESESSLKLTKKDRGVKHIPNRTLRTLEAANGTWPGFTTSEIRGPLSNLKSSKTTAQNNVHSRFLPHLGPKSALFLRQLFNKSWESSTIPLGWRVADIRPVQKSGMNPQKLESYRPISLTTTIGNVMERLVTNRIRYEVYTRGLLSENQAGFRNGHSSQDQLHRL